MIAWRDRLGSLGDVRAFDYPYMQVGRRRPDRLETLVEAHRRALHDLAREGAARSKSAASGASGVVLAGKSMGSRVGCHLALTEPVLALVCLGYPLVGASKNRPLRDEVLKALRVPILFVQGTRDPLCPLDRLAVVRVEMTNEHELVVVEGGDHSLRVGKRALAARGQTQQDVDDRIVRAIGDFIRTRETSVEARVEASVERSRIARDHSQS
jgi:hypothetical protein